MAGDQDGLVQAIRVQAIRVQAIRVQAIRVQAIRVQAIRVQERRTQEAAARFLRRVPEFQREHAGGRAVAGLRTR